MNIFDKLSTTYPNISKDSIAQLSLSSIPDLKFISEFNKDIANISSSAEQKNKSTEMHSLINNILEIKNDMITKEGRLSSYIDFDDRLETQSLKHITDGYSAGDFRQAIDQLFWVKEQNKTINLAPVKGFNYNYYEGIVSLLSTIANKDYPQIEVISHQQGYLPSELENIKASDAVYATGMKHKLLSTFTNELSDEDFYNYKDLNLKRRDEARELSGFSSREEITYNIIDSGLRDSQRVREVNDYFGYNPKLAEYLTNQNTYYFNNSEYDDFKRKFAFTSDQGIKNSIAYFEQYDADILKKESLEGLSTDDKQVVIQYNALKLLIEGPNRFEENNGTTHIENMLRKEINKENFNRYNENSSDPFKDVIKRLLKPEISKDKDPEIIAILSKVDNSTTTKSRLKP